MSEEIFHYNYFSRTVVSIHVTARVGVPFGWHRSRELAVSQYRAMLESRIAAFHHDEKHERAEREEQELRAFDALFPRWVPA
jgi:hypothetical protein